MDKENKMSDQRRQRQLQKIGRETQAEFESTRSQLQQRKDYRPEWDYFLDLLMRLFYPDALQVAVDKPVVEHLCNQAPFELFHAMGVHPARLGSGSFNVVRVSSSRLPVLMCPYLKATMGMFELHGGSRLDRLYHVVPTTCDWVVKFPEMADTVQTTCFLELPHLREDEKGQKRWLEEIYGLVRFLEHQTGRKLKRKALKASVQTFMHAWEAVGRLIELRRRRLLSGIWFMVAINSFLLDPIEIWTEHVLKLLDAIQSDSPQPLHQGLFLAGSPIVFPNFKLLNLIEAAGMDVCADDLCTSERIWPGGVCYDNSSCHGLLKTLAERYHRACICPTFADNERRFNSIFNTLEQHRIRGVVFHVLKGCHPFDIESFGLEPKLKQKGYKFLRIETDYVEEDSRNILTRLEAFSGI